MNANEVTEKILADAQAEADEITKQAQEKTAGEQAELTRELADYKQRTAQLAQAGADDEKSHLLAAARMEIAMELLAEKRKLLDEVFEQAQNQLQTLPDKDYAEFISKLILDAVETGNEDVVVDNNEKRIDMALIKQVNRKLGPGYKGNLRLSDEKQNIAGGFILKNGKIKNNVSFKVLFDQARKELEIELAKVLFS